MYYYETHCHTLPVSKCGKNTDEELLAFYKRLGYDGVFLTNHYIDGNIGFSGEERATIPHADQINFYFDGLDRAKTVGQKLGIRVFPGVEMSYHGTDILVYGLGRDFFLAHPDAPFEMDRSSLITFLRESGALVVQAHPFRKEKYIDHVRLFHDYVEGFEIANAHGKPENTAKWNALARTTAQAYDLLPTAGSDLHSVEKNGDCLCGIKTYHPLRDEHDFIATLRSGAYICFEKKKDGEGVWHEKELQVGRF